MIIPVSVKNQSIDSSGITSDYKAAISEYIWNWSSIGIFCMEKRMLQQN